MKMFYGRGIMDTMKYMFMIQNVFWGEYIGVSRYEYKLYDVTMPTENVIKCYKIHDVTMPTDDVTKWLQKQTSCKFLTDSQPKDIIMSKNIRQLKRNLSKFE